jgi:hypothetical protein
LTDQEVALSFAARTPGAVKLALQHGDAFDLETIAAGLTPGRGTALAAHGRVLHVVYDEPGLRRLWYAVREPNQPIRTLDKRFDQPFFAYAFALDAVGAPRIVAEMERRTVLLSIDHDRFVTETITGEGDFYSMALDAQGAQHIAFFDVPSGHLDLISRTTGGWSRQTVDPSSETGFHASLALDAAGAPHISYRDSTSDGLKYAGWSTSGRLTSQTPGTPE